LSIDARQSVVFRSPTIEAAGLQCTADALPKYLKPFSVAVVSMEVIGEQTSKLNGENIAGAALLCFAFLLMIGGQLNAVLGLLYPAYYILASAGIGMVLLGYGRYGSRLNHEQGMHYVRL
jgi:hypothetical protein